MSEQANPLTRFSVEIDSINAKRVIYNISVSYGGNPPMEVGKPFWFNSGRPRVIAMLSGDRFNPGPEWREWRIPLLDLFLEREGDLVDGAASDIRAEIARIQAEKEVSHV